MSKEGTKQKKVSFFNWLITLFLSIIPGVNLLAFIGMGMFARNPSKRSYALAALVLTLVILITLCVAVIFFGHELVEWAQQVINTAKESTAQV